MQKEFYAVVKISPTKWAVMLTREQKFIGATTNWEIVQYFNSPYDAHFACKQYIRESQKNVDR